MKTPSCILLIGLLAWSASTPAAEVGKGLLTLEVTSVKTNDALALQMSSSGKAVPMGRVMSSLNKKIHFALQQTRKFRLMVHKDLKVIIDEQGLKSAGAGLYNPDTAPRQGELIAAQFSSTVTIDHFLDSKTATVIEALRVKRTTRRIQIGGIVDLIDVSTGESLEAAEVTVTQEDELEERPGQTARDSDDMDELLNKAASEFANRVANRVVDVIYPMKVIDRDESVVTVNRGDGYGLKVGEVLTVYGPAKVVKDPDTGETTKIKGKLIGKVEVSEIDPKTFRGKITEETKPGESIVVGAILNRAPGAGSSNL
jgi:hypothetical protein